MRVETRGFMGQVSDIMAHDPRFRVQGLMGHLRRHVCESAGGMPQLLARLAMLRKPHIRNLLDGLGFGF